jgi:hypothetical protein
LESTIFTVLSIVTDHVEPLVMLALRFHKKSKVHESACLARQSQFTVIKTANLQLPEQRKHCNGPDKPPEMAHYRTLSD